MTEFDRPTDPSVFLSEQDKEFIASLETTLDQEDTYSERIEELNKKYIEMIRGEGTQKEIVLELAEYMNENKDSHDPLIIAKVEATRDFLDKMFGGNK